jgi:hypothetical protein
MAKGRRVTCGGDASRMPKVWRRSDPIAAGRLQMGADNGRDAGATTDNAHVASGNLGDIL